MIRRRLLTVLVLLPTAGCGFIYDRLYYASMEKLGREKRDILAKRVSRSRKDQEQAKEQFQTTLEAFQELTGFDGGDLEKAYNKLNREYERSEKSASDVRNRIRSIERVADDLFEEWDKEADEIGSANLRSQSRTLLSSTRESYGELLKNMRGAEAKMDPVLAAFCDQVLFLKHNLNARAIQSLGDTALEIDEEVAELVADIEASIREADEFVEALSD